MSGSQNHTGRYAALAVLIAAVSLAVTLPLLAGRWDGGALWIAIGWLVMAASGVAGGTWMASVHGAPGAGFALALGASMFGRLLAAAVGATAAFFAGKEPSIGYVVGLAAGFVPLQVFEVIWFARHHDSASAGPGRA